MDRENFTRQHPDVVFIPEPITLEGCYVENFVMDDSPPPAPPPTSPGPPSPPPSPPPTPDEPIG